MEASALKNAIGKTMDLALAIRATALFAVILLAPVCADAALPPEEVSRLSQLIHAADGADVSLEKRNAAFDVFDLAVAEREFSLLDLGMRTEVTRTHATSLVYRLTPAERRPIMLSVLANAPWPTPDAFKGLTGSMEHGVAMYQRDFFRVLEEDFGPAAHVEVWRHRRPSIAERRKLAAQLSDQTGIIPESWNGPSQVGGKNPLDPRTDEREEAERVGNGRASAGLAQDDRTAPGQVRRNAMEEVLETGRSGSSLPAIAVLIVLSVAFFGYLRWRKHKGNP